MRIAFLGNHIPAYSTETHVALELEHLGHYVTRIQEGEVRASEVAERCLGHDVFLWTQTYGLAESGGTRDERLRMLDDVRALSIPSVAFHLDRWWGLDRQDQITGPDGPEPFFRCDLVFTADGGHDEQWEQAGINHFWSPPAVYSGEVGALPPVEEYRARVAFVGSWRHYGHAEWNDYRQELFEHCRRWWPDMAFWPQPGAGAIRGAELNRLYASVDVVIGDSCLVPATDGSPIRGYHSDRIPETLGRGGFLVHPHVDDVTDGTLYEAGKHLACWEMGNWTELRFAVEHYLSDFMARESIRSAGMQHVLRNHTYRQRMQFVLDHVNEGVYT